MVTMQRITCGGLGSAIAAWPKAYRIKATGPFRHVAIVGSFADRDQTRRSQIATSMETFRKAHVAEPKRPQTERKSVMNQITTVNPATEEPIETYDLMTDDAVKNAVQACHNAFLQWQQKR